MPYVFNDLLSRLVGCRLYSVQFVIDYVQLRFDSDETDDQPLLNCDVWPVVLASRRTLSNGMDGYSDALRQLICQRVVDTFELSEGGLRIEFESLALVFRPEPGEIQGPEIASLFGFVDHRWMTWRPGEEAFEYLSGDSEG